MLCKYKNDAFTARLLLAAIDHNAHLHHKPLLSKDGKLMILESNICSYPKELDMLFTSNALTFT